MGEAIMKAFGGKILFLNRSDINTDEIIPAKYLTDIYKEVLRPYLFEDLKIEGFNPKTDLRNVGVIVTRANFGCGSSREHAPWALEANGIHLVIAQSFARIFRQNMFNCGMMAVELPASTIDHLFDAYSASGASLQTDWENRCFLIQSKAGIEKIAFKVSKYDRSLVEAGGWVEYADANY
jgi:3-isopropylmalate/(R)-2-methylmalate dehydratase small subunit